MSVLLAGCSTLRPAYAANRESALVSVRFQDSPPEEPPLFDGTAIKGLILVDNPITMGKDIELQFFEAPAARLARITETSIGRTLVISFYGEYESVGTIQAPIANGRFRLHGSWTDAGAQEILARLRGTR